MTWYRYGYRYEGECAIFSIEHEGNVAELCIAARQRPLTDH